MSQVLLMWYSHDDVFSLQVLLMMPKKHSSYNPIFPLLSCEQGAYCSSVLWRCANFVSCQLQPSDFLKLLHINANFDILLCVFLSRCRIAEYHLDHYEAAHSAFTQGQQLDGEHGLFSDSILNNHRLFLLSPTTPTLKPHRKKMWVDLLV